MKKIVLLSFALSASMMMLASSAKSHTGNLVPMPSDSRIEIASKLSSFSKIEPTSRLIPSQSFKGMATTKLSNTKADEVAPFVHYNRPAGAFYFGYEPQTWGGYKMPVLFGAAYCNNVWPNLSSDATYSWEYTDPTTGEETKSADEDLSLFYPSSLEYVPTLTATTATGSSKYQIIGKDSTPGFFKTGGFASVEGNEDGTFFGVSSKDFSDGAIRYTAQGEGGWWFGTGATSVANGIVGMATFMEKPNRSYVLESMYALAYNFVADPDAELTVTVKEVNDDGGVGEVIATGVCLGADAIVIDADADGGSIVTLPFVFEKIDPTTGLSEEVTPIINSAILVEFTGYQNPKVKSMTLAVSKNNIPDLWGETGYFIIENDGKKGFLALSKAFELYTAPSLFMNIAYTWFETEEDTYLAPNEGGSKTFDVNCTFISKAWTCDEEVAGTLPSWIKIAKMDADDSQKLTFTVDPLPAGTEGRSSNVTMSVYGASKVFKISQGVLGVNDAVVSTIKVANVGGDFQVSYPASVSAVKIYNIAGQLVKDVALTETGSSIIPAQDLAKGIYIMQFNDNQKIKVIK